MVTTRHEVYIGVPCTNELESLTAHACMISRFIRHLGLFDSLRVFVQLDRSGSASRSANSGRQARDDCAEARPLTRPANMVGRSRAPPGRDVNLPCHESEQLDKHTWPCTVVSSRLVHSGSYYDDGGLLVRLNLQEYPPSRPEHGRSDGGSGFHGGEFSFLS